LWVAGTQQQMQLLSCKQYAARTRHQSQLQQRQLMTAKEARQRAREARSEQQAARSPAAAKAAQVLLLAAAQMLLQTPL
jgi:hypothetical protein